MRQALEAEKLNELFRYEDGKLFWKIQPSRRIKAGSRAGGADPRGYRSIRLQNKNIREHRVIFVMHHGYEPEIVDHINGDKSDNRIENLRAATKSLNVMNSKRAVTNTSGVKGVCWVKGESKWHASVVVNKKTVWGKYFTCLSEAAEAVKQARAMFHGEFANHG